MVESSELGRREQRPEAPATMNSEHGAMWRLIEYALDAVAGARTEAREDIAALRSHVNTLLLTIVGSALALGAVIIGTAIWLGERLGAG